MHVYTCEHTLSLHYCDGAQGMSIDDSELREYTHGLFGSMAAILKQDFQPFLATCVAAALASCNQVSHPLHQRLLHTLPHRASSTRLPTKVVTYLATQASHTHACLQTCTPCAGNQHTCTCPIMASVIVMYAVTKVHRPHHAVALCTLS